MPRDAAIRVEITELGRLDEAHAAPIVATACGELVRAAGKRIASRQLT